MNSRLSIYSALLKALTAMMTLSILAGCAADKSKEISISRLAFIGEVVLPANMEFEGTTVGGLSGIDYWNGIYYLISDDNGSASDDVNGQARAYTATLHFDANRFYQVRLTGVIPLNDTLHQGIAQPFAPGTVDPEAVRVDPNNGNLIWANEGQIKLGLNPQIREIDIAGTLIRTLPLHDMFQIDTTGKTGPRHNVVFEGLSVAISGDGFWLAMEGPLIQDGEEPEMEDTDSPIRVSLINRETGGLVRQFAYELDPVAIREGTKGVFSVNGVVDVLEYARDQFLFLERSYVAGQSDGGNDVKLYKVDASNATDVSQFHGLAGTEYKGAEKQLLLDFNDIREQLSTIDDVNIVDNLEGITFGPILPNGHHSLVVVADNNFNGFDAQLNQFLVFQVIPGP